MDRKSTREIGRVAPTLTRARANCAALHGGDLPSRPPCESCCDLASAPARAQAPHKPSPPPSACLPLCLCSVGTGPGRCCPALPGPAPLAAPLASVPSSPRWRRRILETCGQRCRGPGRRGVESALHIVRSRLGCSKSTHAKLGGQTKGGPSLCDAGVIWCLRLQGLGRGANHHAQCATLAAIAKVLMSMTAANHLGRPCDSFQAGHKWSIADTAAGHPDKAIRRTAGPPARPSSCSPFHVHAPRRDAWTTSSTSPHQPPTPAPRAWEQKLQSARVIRRAQSGRNVDGQSYDPRRRAVGSGVVAGPSAAVKEKANVVMVREGRPDFISRHTSQPPDVKPCGPETYRKPGMLHTVGAQELVPREARGHSSS